MDKNQEGLHEAKQSPKKLLWSIVFVLIAVLSVWAVVGQSDSFSFSGFVKYISSSMNPYLLLAFLSVLLYIFFEGLALIRISKSLGHSRNVLKGTVYSAADIYFSAITPSATGGQPASAYFMIKDGIPGSVVTVSLILNLVMYTLSTLTFGLLGIFLDFDVFCSFSTLSKVMIILGIFIQGMLSTFFILVLKKDVILYRLGCGGISLLGKLHIFRDTEGKKVKLRKSLDSYASAAKAIGGRRRVIAEAFVCNLLQRGFLVLVYVFTFLATGGSLANALDVFCVESLVFIGCNAIPIPGAMGVTDFMLLDGFKGVMSAEAAEYLGLLSRSISFYLCVILCGALILFRYLQIRFRRLEKRK